ncbi:hypothetical protein ACJX0J_008131, partial [Zea mays]
LANSTSNFYSYHLAHEVIIPVDIPCKKAVDKKTVLYSNHNMHLIYFLNVNVVFSLHVMHIEYVQAFIAIFFLVCNIMAIVSFVSTSQYKIFLVGNKNVFSIQKMNPLFLWRPIHYIFGIVVPNNLNHIFGGWLNVEMIWYFTGVLIGAASRSLSVLDIGSQIL